MSHSISGQRPADGPHDGACPPRAALAPVGPRSDHVVFQGCTGWLHRPDAANATAPASDVAVLLCPAVGWDGLHCHHGFRLLADRLAQAGHPALRFHYPSTGDSADLPAAPPERWAAWQASVDAAADWLRAVTGARRLVLVGLRLGATLAALAASRRDDVAALALLAPVLRGKSYIRQLDMEARMEGGVALEGGQGLELHELCLDPATVKAISRVDLRQSSFPPGARVTLFPQAPSQLVQRCAEIWREGGVHASCLEFTGLEPLLQEAIHVDLPPPDFSRLLAWVRACGHPGSAPAVPRISPAPAVLQVSGCSETGLRFGRGNRLFGVLCRPDVRMSDTAVVIGNSGRDPHYGIGRFAVEVARGLARKGVASLRMDFAGLGDSPASPGQGEALSPLFEADRTGDIAAAIDALQQDGYTDFAVHGLCSGAYHAYRAALAESRISTLLLVNLPAFEWTGGDTVRKAMWKSAPTSRLLQRLSDRRSWRRVLFGEAGLHAIVQGQAHQLARSIRAGVAGWRGRSAPPLGPEQAAAGLGRRGVRMQLLYSPADPGWDALEATFGQAGARLRASAGAEIRTVPGVNHVLTTQRMREEVFALMAGYLIGNSLPELAMPEARCA